MSEKELPPELQQALKGLNGVEGLEDFSFGNPDSKEGKLVTDFGNWVALYVAMNKLPPIWLEHCLWCAWMTVHAQVNSKKLTNARVANVAKTIQAYKLAVATVKGSTQ